MADEPAPSQLSYFNAYKSVYGNSWNMVWNNDNSIPLTVYGGHFKSKSISPNSSLQQINPASYNQDALQPLPSCTPLPLPQLPSLPAPLSRSKLILMSFSPTHSYISPDTSSDIGSLNFVIDAGVKPVAGLEPVRTRPKPNNHKKFYLRWNIVITSANGSGNILKGDTQIIPSNATHQGADITIPVTAEVAWSGEDQNGNVLPDGEYTYRLKLQFIRVAVMGNGKTMTMIIDELTSGIGSLIIDTRPPHISILTPVSESMFNNPSVDFKVNYYDCGAGLNVSSFNAILNQKEQTSQFATNESMASLSATLNNDVYTFVAQIRDKAGNPATAIVHFTVLADGAMEQYNNAMEFLQSVSPLYGFKSDLSDLKFIDYFTSATSAMTVQTPSGTKQYVSATAPKYLRFQQVYDNRIRVYGAVLNVSLDTDNNPTDIFGDYYNDIPAGLVITPTVDFPTVMSVILDDLGITGLKVSPTSGERVIYKDNSGVYHVAIVLSLVTMDNTPWMYIVDLHNGAILYKYKTRSADYVTGQGRIFVGSLCNNTIYRGACEEPLDWMLNGGEMICCGGETSVRICYNKALTGKYANIDDLSISECGLLVPTLVRYNSAHIYDFVPLGNELSQFDEVNAYYNITKSAEYYLNHYGFELSHQDGHPVIPVTINDTSLIPLNDAALTTDYIENNCGNWQWFCDFFGYTKSIKYHISFAPDYADNFAVAFHEYNHAVVDDITNSLYTTDYYMEGMAQFYANFLTLDNGYLSHDSTYSDTWLNYYLYPYDYGYLYCSMPDTFPSCSGFQPEPHYDGFIWEQPLLRLRQWEINISGHPQIIYDDTFNAIYRIGSSFSFEKGLVAMLAAEDNKSNVLGFEHEYYNILASFAWEGIRIPAYTLNGQPTTTNLLVIGGQCASKNASGNCTSVKPLLAVNYRDSSDFNNEHIYFDEFSGRGTYTIILLSPNAQSLSDENIWDEAFHDSYSGNTQGCLSSAQVYYADTFFHSADDLQAGTSGGRTLQAQEHAKGIYNNLHKTVALRLGDMSCIAASSSPLSFGKLYYRLVTYYADEGWITSATHGEQSILIYSPNPAGGGCTIAQGEGHSRLFEFLFVGFIIIIFIKMVRYAKSC